MTMSLSKGQGKPIEPAHPQIEPWAVAARSAGTTPDRVRRVRQVHGRGVRVLQRGRVTAADAAVRPDGDAIVSNEPGLALSVSVADCVPILIADAKSGAAAAVHAGWRGTCARVAAAAIETLQRACGTSPADCVAAIGPSIGPEDYTVGTELVDAYLAAGHPRADIDRWFRRSQATLTLDLWSANRDQLVAAGVRPGRVFTCGLSTLAYREVFESYRADGEKAGRMAGLIVVPRGR
jgi:YfiH family protein